MRSILLVVLAALAFGCSSGVGRPVREVTAIPGPEGVQYVRITAHSYWFDPNRIVVRANAPVQLTIKNGSLIVPHNLTCQAPEAGIDLDEGVGMFKGSTVVRFTPKTPGEYPFFCGRGSHAKKGMTGTIVVIP